ncbi:MAG: TfoX/Sxy family protein [Acidimicrobiia bacterium]
MPKPSDQTKELFTAVVSRQEDAEVKAMFGNLGGFVNGNMFCGLFGDDLGVRLDDANRATLIAAGGDDFGPEDRPMKQYAAVPRPWLSVNDPNLSEWLTIAYDYVSQMPPKVK